MSCDELMSGLASRCLIILLTCAGIYMQVLAARECEFLEYTEQYSRGSIGLQEWRPAGTNYCRHWQKPEATAYIRWPQIAIVLASVSAAVGLFCVTIECLFTRFGGSHFLLALFYHGAEACTGLVFLLFGSTYCKSRGVCQLGRGANLNIGAFVAYLSAHIIICSTSEPVPLIETLADRKSRPAATN